MLPQANRLDSKGLLRWAERRPVSAEIKTARGRGLIRVCIMGEYYIFVYRFPLFFLFLRNHVKIENKFHNPFV